MLPYLFVIASAVGVAFLLHGLWSDSPRAVWVSLLAFVVMPVLVWRLALAERDIPEANYVIVAIGLAATILGPAYFGYAVARLVGTRFQVRTGATVAVAIGSALVIWLPLLLLGNVAYACNLYIGCDF
jgi:hypothetical protein